MMKFRKRQNVEIEAYRLTSELVIDALENRKKLPGLHLSSASWNFSAGEVHYANFTCVTVHGQETKVTLGDWVITEPDGVHHYPCKPEIFEKTYEVSVPQDQREI